ncbi:MAG: 2-dehydropantoate 2-reductase [Actinomycetia bacterium]|nr:2-dehydropantoate 2-reductase [Actinomycetes bacterium]
MRYVIYGAGAVGGVIGGRLHASGADVVLIARGDHLDAVQAHGLRLLTPEGEELHHVPAVATPDALDLTDDDVVLLTMKGQDTVAALDALTAAAPPGIAVVCAQNGVANERSALRRFADVYGMIVWLPAVFVTPGTVLQHAAPVAGSLDVGRYPSGVDDRAARISADLRHAGFASTPDPAIMAAKYRKLLSNLGNALDALCDGAFQSPLFGAAQAEAEAVLAAAGIDVRSRDEAAVAHVQIREVPGHEWAGSSSRQSFARGTGTIEVDFLNGEIVLLGRLHGVPTPVNELLQREARAAARAGLGPGAVKLSDLEAKLGQPTR